MCAGALTRCVECSPLSRAIKDEVPSFYLPQVQVLMEILDLEKAAFIQYRPESEWAGMEFQCTEVPRDREWFNAHKPSMLSFWETWKGLAKRDDVRELLVRKRAVSLPPDHELAARALARRPCCFVSEVAVAQGEADEVAVVEPAVAPTRFPSSLAQHIANRNDIEARAINASVLSSLRN